MQRTVQADPDRLYADATAFMVNSGASVEGQTPNSLTFTAKEAPAFGLGGMLLGAWATDTNTMMNAATATGIHANNAATLVVVEGPGGVTVTVPDHETAAANLLRFWFVANVLRESLPNPMMKAKGDPQVWIWNDRVEVYRRTFRLKHEETVRMEDISSVDLHKGRMSARLTIHHTGGGEIPVKALTPQDAENAKAMLESRLAFYRTATAT
jgi:hypothetical protein